MNFLSFTLYTTLGAFIWNVLLALLGYLAHGQSDLIDKYNKELSIISIVAFGLLVLFFIIRKLLKKKK
jgi:membrane protein DedA with SNARE-associated domain